VPSVVDTAGAITIPYRLLADIIGRLDPADVVTLATDATEVTVTTLSGAYKLSGGPAEDFPALPAVEASEAVCVAFEPAVLVAASTDEAKQMLTGINVSITSGTITQAATDGHRLSMRSYATEAADMAFTIPARAIRRIEGNVLLAIDKQQAAMVTADGTTITSRLLDGTYPNVQQLIPPAFTHTLTCERKHLLHALERVAVIGDIIKFTAAKSLAITAETDAGSGAESLAATGTLPPCAFNASYLIDGLKGLPGDTVTIYSHNQIVQYGSEKWGITERQVRDYLAEARKLLALDAELARPEWLEAALARAMDYERRASDKDQLGTALMALDKQARLLRFDMS
jgi:DNA polymerase III subunit beta